MADESPLNQSKREDLEFNYHKVAQTTFSERLKYIIGKSSITTFARKCGLSEGAIRKYLKEDAQPTLSNLLIMAKEGNVSVTWLATGSHTDNISKHAQENISTLNSNEQYILLPEFIINDNEYSFSYTSSFGSIVLNKQWLFKEDLSEGTVALFQITDDCMLNALQPGDIAFIHIKEKGWGTKLKGIFILELNNTIMLKRIQFDPIRSGYHISNDNQKYQSFFIPIKNADSLKVIAKVVRVIDKIS